ncbi:hypothetical protein YC2023_013752 [Brassica napus]
MGRASNQRLKLRHGDKTQRYRRNCGGVYGGEALAVIGEEYPGMKDTYATRVVLSSPKLDTWSI